MKLVIFPVVVVLFALACGSNDDSPSSGVATETAANDIATATATSPPSTAAVTPAGVEPSPTEARPTGTARPLPFDGGTAPVIEVRELGSAATLVEVRAAAHDGFDRIVFEFAGDAVPGYRVQYLAHVVACGSGELVALSLPGHTLSRATTGHGTHGRGRIDSQCLENRLRRGRDHPCRGDVRF